MEQEVKKITELIDDYAAKVRAINEAGQEINKILEIMKERINTQETAQKAATAAAGLKMDIYRDGYFEPHAQKIFEQIENAMGFKLFFWQKMYIITGKFRCYGATTAEALKMLIDTDERPIDYTTPTRNQEERVFRDELKEIQYRLAASGIKTRPVFWNKTEKRKFYEHEKRGRG